ncbi:DUF1972 domain-containing protein [Williamsia sp. SKLECPSW1]
MTSFAQGQSSESAESRIGDRKLRIAVIGSRGYPSYYGGFETLVRRLAPYLVDCGHGVVVFGRPGATEASNAERDSRVVSRTTAGIERRSLSTMTYGLTAAVDREVRGVDVAFVMNVANGFWLPILRLRGVRTVVNVDGLEWQRAKWGPLARFVFRSGAILTARYADELVFDAQAIADYWQEKFSRTGTVIPYGGDVDFDTVSPSPFAPRSYVLVVARFVPENTIPEFLDSVEAIAEHAHIVMVGSSGYGGPLEERVRLLDRDNKNFTWMGHVKDDRLLFTLWQQCGAYFHGHSVGGTNPALVQAMACGAPIVARDTPFNREVLGHAGVFVAPSSSEIANGVRSVVSSETRRDVLSREARARAATHYSWVGVCDSYRKLLTSAGEGERAWRFRSVSGLRGGWRRSISRGATARK